MKPVHIFIPSHSPEGYFIYQECDNVSNGGSIRLLSPVLSSSATQICVQFYYYMYGIDNRNVLRVVTRRPGGEEEAWNKTGIQSPSWLNGFVTVSKSANESITVSVILLFVCLFFVFYICCFVKQVHELKISHEQKHSLLLSSF